MKIPKIRTILFTEVCPIHCNYCNLETSPNWGTVPQYTKEKFLQEVDQADKDGVDRIVFTGGEPFCFWSWIKEVIEKYGNRFQYSFNTNGYYCTDEILKFLSKYSTTFQLSVDGPREIAMWRRPNRYNFNYDYWDTFEKNIPAFLYYFPNITWKSIISKRLIPYLPKIYGAAANYGFRSILFEIDFEEQPWRAPETKDPNKAWTKEDFEKYRQSMVVITEMMIEMIEQGAFPTLERTTKRYLEYILNPHNKDFSILDLNCGLAHGRDMSSIYSQDITYHNCLNKIASDQNLTMDQLFQKIEERAKEGCGIKSDCPFFDFCSKMSCIKDNYTQTGDFFTPTTDYCQQSIIGFNQAIAFLEYGNKHFKDNQVYIDFIRSLVKGGVR